MRTVFWLVILSLVGTVCSPAALAQEDGRAPLKVFVLVGQSNMDGHARIGTFGYLAEDPATVPLLQQMQTEDGTPRMIPNVWISSYQAHQPDDPNGEGAGQLTAGYGARRDATRPGDKIGPELTFGITLQNALQEPILIIKTAWGGKSLFLDLRPPSAGPYRLTEQEIERLRAQGRDVAEEQARRTQTSGAYYRLMIGHVRHVLEDIGRVCPVYEEGQGYEIAGIVWFQGWNDMVNRNVYPRRGQEGGYDDYSDLLATFIRDVRRDLDAPDVPFVIGVMGVGGPIENVNQRYRSIHRSFREAMAAPASLPEFEDNVAAVQTAPFWDMTLDRLVNKRNAFNQQRRRIDRRLDAGELTEEEAAEETARLQAQALTPDEEELLERGVSNAAYHYLGCAKTMARIGEAFANALLRLRED